MTTNEQMLRSPAVTLRDYFAAHALAALISKAPLRTVIENSPEELEEDLQFARGAYEYADAMLAVRREAPNA